MCAMKKIPLMTTATLFGVLTVHAASENSKAEQPNFIIINCDDLGFGDLACFGHPTIKTPHLDQMAAEGQKWSSFYVSASVSSPGRAGLLTGRLGVRTGMYGDKRRVLFPNSPKGLPQSEVTIAKLLQTNGYNTACIGKWHVGHKPESMPLQHGFDYFYGSPFSNDMSKKEQAKIGNKNYPFEYPIYDQEKIVETDPDQTQITKRLMQKTISYIETNKEKPFFIYLAQPMPHFPVYASKEFQGKSARGLYGDCVEELDWSVGEILKTLKENNLDKNTLVIFTSDNGPWLSYKELGGSAGHLREGKASICEGGFRVPCIMWGGMVEPAHITDMGSTLDFLPTFCEMANIDLPTDRTYDGVSLNNVITHNDPSNRELFYFYRGSDLYAMRKGDYKIFFSYKSGYGSDAKKVYDVPHLYNIAHDPEERYNIANKHMDVVNELKAHAKDYLENTKKAPALFDLKE